MPIATPRTIVAPPSSAILTPRQSTGSREKRALIIPTIKRAETDKPIDTGSAVPAENRIYGVSGMREARTPEIKKKNTQNN